MSYLKIVFHVTYSLKGAEMKHTGKTLLVLLIMAIVVILLYGICYFLSSTLTALVGNVTGWISETSPINWIFFAAGIAITLVATLLATLISKKQDSKHDQEDDQKPK